MFCRRAKLGLVPLVWCLNKNAPFKSIIIGQKNGVYFSFKTFMSAEIISLFDMK